MKRENPLHMIHRWSIEHPYAVVAFYVAVLALAWIAITSLVPRRFAPYVESPMVGVVTMMPGLSAQEMELYVSKPIEEQLVNVKGLRYIRSSSQDGFSIVTLEFPYGSNMQRALTDVQALMNVTQAQLPATGANLKPSFVVPIDPLNLPILSLSLRGDPNKGWDMVKVREFADNVAINRFKTVEDVYSVVPFGGYRRQLQVIVDREKLAGYGLSILDVRNAIDRSNVSTAAGTITEGAYEGTIRVDTRAQTAQDVLNYPIRASGAGSAASPTPSGGMGGMGGGMGGGAPAPASPTTESSVAQGAAAPVKVVYIRDVAKVVDAHWERRSAYRYLDGVNKEVIPSIEVSVIQNPGASSATV
ncbi:MAG TPA: efflux RND transporter permease subunit, partial [Fimbriimonas sp.]